MIVKSILSFYSWLFDVNPFVISNWYVVDQAFAIIFSIFVDAVVLIVVVGFVMEKINENKS